MGQTVTSKHYPFNGEWFRKEDHLLRSEVKKEYLKWCKIYPQVRMVKSENMVNNGYWLIANWGEEYLAAPGDITLFIQDKSIATDND